jgi:hypothetical protein
MHFSATVAGDALNDAVCDGSRCGVWVVGGTEVVVLVVLCYECGISIFDITACCSHLYSKAAKTREIPIDYYKIKPFQ